MANSLFQELKRRNVIKVVSGYLLLGWLVLQVADVFVPALGLPDWTMKLLIVLGLVGLPFVVFISWAFEMTPEGLKRDAEVHPTEQDQAYSIAKDRKIDFIVIALLVMALGYSWFKPELAVDGQVDSATAETASTQAASQQDASNTSDATNDEAVNFQMVTTEQPVEGASIAVLPFENMSSDPEQEYFSDGISEEILTLLTKIPNLRVISRASSFYYKGKDINPGEVAEELQVANILTGSVRKSGDKLRITVALTDAVNNQNIWSESYNRELTDIFAIQDEISTAVVNSLKQKLGIKSAEINRDMADVSLEAYNENLKGINQFNKRTSESMHKALEHFDKAVKLSPSYTTAWVNKAKTHHLLSEYIFGEMPPAEANRLAKQALDKALALEPNSSQALAALSSLQPREQAIDTLERVIEINPNDASAISALSHRLPLSESKRRLELAKKAVELEPRSLIANSRYAIRLLEFGQLEEFLAVNSRIEIIEPGSVIDDYNLVSYYMLKGQQYDAFYHAQKAVELIPTNPRLLHTIVELSYSLGFFEQIAPMIANTPYSSQVHRYTDNLEQYIIATRQQFPRSEEDDLGNYLRGRAELQAKEYEVAEKYLQKQTFCSSCYEIIFALKQVGKVEQANEIIQQRIVRFDSMYEQGIRFAELDYGLYHQMILALDRNDVEQAVNAIESMIDNKQLMHSEFFISPMYQSIHEHPKWPELAERYKKLMAEQRMMYIKKYIQKSAGHN